MENQDDSQWNEDAEESFYGIGSRALQANPQQPLVTDVSLWPPMSVRNSEHTTCDYQALTTSPPDPSQILGFFGPGSLSNAQFENTMNSSAAGNFDMPFQRQINSVYQPLFNPSFVGIQQYSRLPKEGWTPEQDNLLLTLRREGREYSQIADQMRIDFGIVTSENRLVKRFQKIQDQYLEVSPVLKMLSFHDFIPFSLISRANECPPLEITAPTRGD